MIVGCAVVVGAVLVGFVDFAVFVGVVVVDFSVVIGCAVVA